MKKLKKLMAVVLCVSTLLAMVTAMPFTASAAEEINAVNLTEDVYMVSDSISGAEETKYYKFTLATTTYVSLSVDCDCEGDIDEKLSVVIKSKLFKDDMTNLIDERVCKNDVSLDVGIYDTLEKGEYFLALSVNKPVTYNVRYRVEPRPCNDVEPNNYFTTAQTLDENEIVIGAITMNDRVDVYKFTIDKQSKVNLYQIGTNIDSANGLKYELYKEKASSIFDRYVKLYKERYAYWLSSEYEYFGSEGIDYTDEYEWGGEDSFLLGKGTYYVVIESKYIDNNDIYKLKYNTEEVVPAFQEPPYGKFNVTKIQMKAGGMRNGLKVCGGEVTGWSSSDKKIIKVSKKNGTVVALQKGTADVVATLKDGNQIKYKVTVTTNPKFEKGEKTIKSVKVKKGKSVKVKISGVRDCTTKDYVKYTNSKNAKVSFDKSASTKNWTHVIKVKGVKVGTSYVKVKVNGVKTLKLKVKVEK